MNMKKLIAISKNKLLPFIFLKSWSTLLLASILFFITLNSCDNTQEESKNQKQKTEAIKIVTFGGTVPFGTYTISRST